MPILRFTFPGKRYHATPWGAHVNEAQVEWPPSPWRVYRALLATGMNKLGWREDDLPSAAYELIDALSAVLPEYELSEPLTAAHTRHYMPIPGNTTKVFDGFAHVGDQPLRMSWAVDLTPAAFALFERLATGLSYLGRAETWIEATLTEGALTSANCRPCTSPELDEHAEPVTLLAPMTAAEFATWRMRQLAERPEKAAAGRARRPRGKAGPSLIPDTLVDSMMRTTDELQRQGWNMPPGTRRVLYARPRDTLVTAQPAKARSLRVVRDPVEFALIALTSYAARGEVLPRLERSVPQMEQLHRALAKRLDLLPGRPACPALTGRSNNDDNNPLQSGHRHAHYIPLSLSGRDAIDHILVYAPMGLDEPAQAVLERLTWIFSADASERRDAEDRDERNRLTTTLVATGDRTILRDALTRHSAPDILASSTTWESLTPFVAPRFVKNNHPLDAQVRAELRSRNITTEVDIEPLPQDKLLEAGFLRFVRFRRRDKPQPPSPRPWYLRLRFAEPVSGPLALGYASHFGLGLFKPTTG